MIAGGKVLHQRDFVAGLVVRQLVDEAAGHENAKAPFAEAERLARSALEDIRSTEDLAPAEADFRAHLGEALRRQDRFADALVELDWARESKSKLLPQDHPAMLDIRIERAEALLELGRSTEARDELLKVYAVLEPLNGATAPDSMIE